MTKITLAKWAVAALLAVPAVPMFGKTLHHRLVVRRSTHTALVTTSTHKHTLTHKTTRHVTYSTHRRVLSTHHVTSAHRLTHKTTRHTSLNTTSKFKVHVTKLPPTIDGINA
jgi:hypothetical protein